MKSKYFLCAVTIFVTMIVNAQESMPQQNFKSEMTTIQLGDGERVTARMCLPDSGRVGTIVVIAHGSGPNTYLDKRPGFNYYDVLAEGFCERGVGFYTYNRRGVDMGEIVPMFDTVYREQYDKYTPLQEAVDIESHIAAIRKDKRFRNCKIVLYGISEGTIIAPLVAERDKVHVDGLLLHGYCNDNMYDIIRWQNEGGVIRMYTYVMDRNGDGAISRTEYEDPQLKHYRVALLQDTPFDSLDVIKDNVWNAHDIGKVRMAHIHQQIMDAVAAGDDSWIWDNYFRGTVAWLRGHFALEANKTQLLRLNLPIHIFHGTHDENVPVEGVYDIAERFRVCGKTNLSIHVFERHNHNLNFELWLRTKRHSEGTQAIFDTAAEM